MVRVVFSLFLNFGKTPVFIDFKLEYNSALIILLQSKLLKFGVSITTAASCKDDDELILDEQKLEDLEYEQLHGQTQ